MKFTFKHFLLIVLFSGLAIVSNAQLFRTSNYWRQYRKEINVGFGAANFLGELGGRDRIGSDFLWDLEFSETNFAGLVGYRYYIKRNMSVRGQFFIAQLSGNDQLTKEYYRRNRNLHFKSLILEGSGQFEFHLVEEKLGHRYNLKGARGQKGFIFGTYLFAGIGGFHFNPKAQIGKEWYKLAPLNTEGQGLPGGPKDYKKMSVCVPVGIGFKTAINQKIRVGLEFSYRKTFTDYIDDASGNYYNREAIRAASGDVAAYLSDPSLGIDGVQYGPNDIRGDKTDKDAYLFGTAVVSYKLAKKSRYGGRKRSIKTRRSMPSF